VRGQEDEIEKRGAVRENLLPQRAQRNAEVIELIEMSQLIRKNKLSSSLCYSVSSVVEI
jgi:hypothetical protein